MDGGNFGLLSVFSLRLKNGQEWWKKEGKQMRVGFITFICYGGQSGIGQAF